MSFFENVKTGYTFDDVLLVQNYCFMKSRSEVDLSCEIGNAKLKLPIISANMTTVTGSKMARALSGIGCSSALHRFFNNMDELKKNIEDILRVEDIDCDNDHLSKTGISLGINKDKNEEIMKVVEEFQKMGCNFGYFIVDVAHGGQEQVLQTVRWFREKYNYYLVAGNVASKETALRLVDAGADCVKAGVGPGSACNTRKKSGVGYPQLSCIKQISECVGDCVDIIADGGIKTSGDIVKALAAGADFVMLGSMLAGSFETPGQVLTLGDGNSEKKVKLFTGMASYDAQIKHFQKDKKDFAPEGVANFVSYKGSVKNIIHNLEQGIRSGFTYCGCQDISQIHEYGNKISSWVRITDAGYNESVPHTLLKNV